MDLMEARGTLPRPSPGLLSWAAGLTARRSLALDRPRVIQYWRLACARETGSPRPSWSWRAPPTPPPNETLTATSAPPPTPGASEATPAPPPPTIPATVVTPAGSSAPATATAGSLSTRPNGVVVQAGGLARAPG